MAKASEKLHGTPVTISIQLRELEKQLSVKLLRKAGYGAWQTAISEVARKNLI